METNEYGIPQGAKKSLQDYFKHGYCPGDFLLAVLSNDLIGAASKADGQNKHLLFNYANYIYNKLPCGCYGSQEAVRRWVDTKNQEKPENE